MYYEIKDFAVKVYNKHFFDFTLKNGHMIIINYKLMNREIIVDFKNNELLLGGEKKKKEVNTISKLKQILDKYLSAILSIVNHKITYYDDYDEIISSPIYIKTLNFQINLQSEDRERLINQIVFDILFDKYLAECPQMTLQEYSRNQSFIFPYNSDAVDSIRKCIGKATPRFINTMNNPFIRENIERLGFNPDKWFNYLGQKNGFYTTQGAKQKKFKKPKIIWDYIFYNGTQELITSKQFLRSFNKNNNYSYSAIVNLFNEYDKFVSNAFMQQPKNSEDYFIKSMEFYYLEIYKRIDFIYKLALRLENEPSIVIYKNHPLVKRFHPIVVCPIVDNNEHLNFIELHKYYRPMLMIEDLWQEQKLYNNPLYLYTLQNYHLIRAKVYEIFNYHAKFISNDYNEISNFLKTHYNILCYHDSNKIWIQPDKKRKYERNARVKKALEINNALFEYSEKRVPKKWNPNEAS